MPIRWDAAHLLTDTKSIQHAFAENIYQNNSLMSCGNDPWATKEAAAHGRDVPQGNEWLSDWVMVLASVMPIR